MLKIIDADFKEPAHRNAVIKLMNHYMTDPMGDSEPHSEENSERLITGLKEHCNKLCLLAE